MSVNQAVAAAARRASEQLSFLKAAAEKKAEKEAEQKKNLTLKSEKLDEERSQKK